MSLAPAITDSPATARPPENPPAPFTAIVNGAAQLRPGFLPAVEEALRGAGSDTCVFTDFAVSGEPVAVGEWSIERSRWQHWTGPVMVVPTRTLREGSAAEAFINAPRRSGDVRHVAQVLVDTAADDLRQLTAAERQHGPRPASLGPTSTVAASHRGALRAMPNRSLVIPTRGSTGRLAGRRVRWLDQCLHSLGELLDDPGVDVVLVLDDDVHADLAAPWREKIGNRLTVVTTPGPFNFPAKVNAGVAAAQGQVIALLNDDVSAIDADWLDRMTIVAMEPDVGAVGATLIYADGTVQHRGHVFVEGGVRLLGNGEAPTDPGYRNLNLCDRDVSGVTGACLVQRKEVWERVGGMDPAFPVAFNDVDYTERLRRMGMRTVLCTSVTLHHFESRTRRGDATPAELELLRQRWAPSLDAPDPFTPQENRTDHPTAPTAGILDRLRRRRAALLGRG